MIGRLILLVTAWALLAGAARADSIEGATSWLAMDEAAKRGYVMGVMDKSLSISEDEEEIGACIKEVNPSTDDVVRLVDQKYGDQGLAKIPGYIVVYRSVYELCFAFISQSDPKATAPSVYWEALKAASRD